MTDQGRLQQIIDQGHPGQAEHARQLLQRLDDSGGQALPELADEINLLYDAYLHDPYLTRYEGSEQ